MSSHYIKILVFIFTLSFGSSSSAGLILVSGDSNLNLSGSQLSTFYSNLFSGQDVFASPSTGFFVGNTETVISASAGSFTRGSVSAAALVGIDWFIGGGDAFFTAPEIADIAAFASGGGEVFLIGEGTNTFNAQNATVNAVLSALGSSISLGAPNSAVSSWTATGANIAADPLTAGITLFGGNFASSVSGGTSLFTSDTTGLTVVAVERMDDQGQVPTPTTLALLGLGLAGLGWARRRKA